MTGRLSGTWSRRQDAPFRPEQVEEALRQIGAYPGKVHHSVVGSLLIAVVLEPSRPAAELLARLAEGLGE